MDVGVDTGVVGGARSSHTGRREASDVFEARALKPLALIDAVREQLRIRRRAALAAERAVESTRETASGVRTQATRSSSPTRIPELEALLVRLRQLSTSLGHPYRAHAQNDRIGIPRWRFRATRTWLRIKKKRRCKL